MAGGLVGVKLTTSSVRDITKDLEDISGSLKTIIGNFKDIMETMTGQSEGGLIDQTVTAGEQLYDGGIALAKCFLDLGDKIGSYLQVMLNQDSEMANQLLEQIRR